MLWGIERIATWMAALSALVTGGLALFGPPMSYLLGFGVLAITIALMGSVMTIRAIRLARGGLADYLRELEVAGRWDMVERRLSRSFEGKPEAALFARAVVTQRRLRQAVGGHIPAGGREALLEVADWTSPIIWARAESLAALSWSERQDRAADVARWVDEVEAAIARGAVAIQEPLAGVRPGDASGHG